MSLSALLNENTYLINLKNAAWIRAMSKTHVFLTTHFSRLIYAARLIIDVIYINTVFIMTQMANFVKVPFKYYGKFKRK